MEENHAQTKEEVANKVLDQLRNLGKQTFGLSPFDRYFDSWLKDLREVLSEFESSATISVDDQYLKERSQTISNIELKLEERRNEEASRQEIAKSLSDSRVLLERIEGEYTANMRKLESQKDSEIKRLSSKISGLKEELDRVTQMKTGVFRAISKKTKAQKEAEATRSLSSAQSELEQVVQGFTAEQKRLRDDYERRKQPLFKQIRGQQKEIEKLEIDSSREGRLAACEALINSVNALLQRKEISLN